MIGISIIIPTYNREQFIREAIKSVIDQDYDGIIEIIISDDGSSDTTIKIAETFGAKVKVIRKPENCQSQGASGARNRGINASTQPYICFLDSDDFFLPGHLIKIATVLESRPNLGFAFCRTLEMDEGKGKRHFREWTRTTIKPVDVLNPVVSGNDVVHTNIFIFKRFVFDKVGFFNEKFVGGEDGDLWMRISEIYRGSFSDHFGAVIRKHGVGQLSDYSKKKVLECYHVIFSNALKRYYTLGLSDNYRLYKLKLLVLKYKFSYLALFHSLYPLYYNYKRKKLLKSADWFELSHFHER